MLVDDLRLALDPVEFARSLEFEPDPWQQKALQWTGRQLLLLCARQTGKSTTTAILALHRALYFPKSLILLVSPSQRQSSELFRKVTEYLQRLDVQPELLEDNRLSCALANGSRVVSLPTKEATIRGFSGASLIIEDEAARCADDLYRAVRPMLAVSGGRLILMSTPFGKRGHFFEEWSGANQWERISIKATECPRISADFLAEEQRSMPSRWYAQEYMCSFEETEDSVFNYDLIMAAMDPTIQPLFASEDAAWVTS